MVAVAWMPDPSVSSAARRFVEHYDESGLPPWVEQLYGPFAALGLRGTMNEYLSDVPSVIWRRWAEIYLPSGGLGNMCVPFPIYSEEGALQFCFAIFLGLPSDAERMGRFHVSKSARLSRIVQRHVVNTADVDSWKQQRRGIIDAFLPLRELAKMVPDLVEMSDSVVRLLSVQGPGEVDVKSWLHHAALGMFLRCMLGDPRAFPSLTVDVKSDLSDGSRDLLFKDTTPANSAPVRALFNLESVGRDRGENELSERLSAMAAFSTKLIVRARKRAETGSKVGPLMERLLEMRDDPELMMSNFFATIIAGHDTTAFTMQYLLMELARAPELQHRVREESVRVMDEIAAEGRTLAFRDLPRFELITRCIAETLRLWNVAAITFSRVTAFGDNITGLHNRQVKIPKGTHFTFWFYGLHHSPELWGDDPFAFNPDRQWHPHELQRGSINEPLELATTPSTRRYHPFSLAPRDCMGKGFALTEMRILLPRLLRRFHFDLPTGSELATVKPVPDDATFAGWARKISGPVQPHSLVLRIQLRTTARL